MSDAIQTIVMPKWGLAMQEGLLAAWHVEEGQAIEKGQEILDIETSKIANVFESPVSGKLRKKVVREGETTPVGALLGVVADDSVSDAAIEAFIADFQAKFAEAQAASIASAGPEPAFVEVAGRRLRYLEMGEAEGVPVVFVHGFGGDLNNWLFNQPAIAEKHTTYAVDLPGHGGSSKEVGAGTVQAMSEALLGFLAALGVHRAHLVGHSMGGAVALNLALHHPEHVASATLICSAGLGPDISMDYIDGFIAANRRKKMEPVLQMLVANPDLVTGEMIEDVLKYKRLDGVEQALKIMREALFPNGRQALVLKGQVDGVRHPVQVIWGAEDRVVPVAHAEGLPANVKVTILEGAGHLAHMEKAQEVNALIEEIVRRAG
ncbi:acetoin dehydrogenase dihydrolipoyllysine-residue acetyltransferase subunit [Benzoatithermus flavus]|uniref:Acetoin dehydrogenase dihydrolipoyllysine-residue acetyltransferase subunit n=1 Tax=Benzoatithermus flavus TaxID=3108223 RepID=A0ABU8XQR8_9PROT